MNIHVSKLLQKMDDELRKAKASQNDNEIRESLIVIKSLCDVVLAEKNSLHIPSPKTNEINQSELQKMMGNLAPVKTASPLPDNKIEEEDANGDSLFDF
ncbi:YwdI family protein [Metabacillus malikii]|uniref:YwdI family protein n=1 Tax=Metabacillus malikii TaxID=1504265 RepID=A0ABT9ZEV3_9BACI|nr:YwdI family protein [Metabacillus malikii]MDQ0230791.1 hypothetical protein [Metabacillus malikii]